MWRSIIVSLCVGLLFCGCGDSNSVPPPPVKEMPASIPPPTAAAPSRSTAKRVDSKRKSKSEELSEESGQEKTSNDFRVAPNAPGMLVIPPDEVPEQNLYALGRPVVDSSYVSVEPRVDEQGRDVQNDEINLRLPSGFVQATDAEVNERGFPNRILCQADGAEMVLIDGGVFTQGTNSGPADAAPEHFAFVSPFYMDVTEVTSVLYQDFLSEIKKSELQGSQLGDQDSPQHPAAGVAWNFAVKYAESRGKSLPTEAEWERAARGPRGNSCPWGNGHPPRKDGLFETILPVASRPTDLTPTGLYDMAGNVREWTADWYSDSAYLASSDGEILRDPRGPKRSNSQSERVVKGSRDSWHLWTRGHANLRKSSVDIGFRCILRITDEMIISDENSSPAARPKATTRPSSRPPRTNSGF